MYKVVLLRHGESTWNQENRFTGWKDYVHDGFLSWEGPMAQARSWLLREGWKRHGLLDLRPVWDINAA